MRQSCDVWKWFPLMMTLYATMDSLLACDRRQNHIRKVLGLKLSFEIDYSVPDFCGFLHSLQARFGTVATWY
jgi:hypothetical protein